MNEDTFNRATAIQVTLRRVNKVLDAVNERDSVVIHGEHFSVKHPLGAAVLAELRNYKKQLTEEFDKL